MAETRDSTAKSGGSQSGNPWPRLATSCSWERRPNSDQTVGPVMLPRRRIASPAVDDGDSSPLLAVSAVGESPFRLSVSLASGDETQMPSKQGALSIVSNTSSMSVFAVDANCDAIFRDCHDGDDDNDDVDKGISRAAKNRVL